MLSNFNSLKDASMIELRNAESSLRAELRNKSHPELVHKAARKNLDKILTEIRRRSR